MLTKGGQMQGTPSVGQAFGQGVEACCPPVLWDFVFILPLALMLYLLFRQVVPTHLPGPAELTGTLWV